MADQKANLGSNNPHSAIKEQRLTSLIFILTYVGAPNHLPCFRFHSAHLHSVASNLLGVSLKRSVTGNMDHSAIARVLALILGTAVVHGRGDLRSLFVIRGTETIGVASCVSVPCTRIDIDYEALRDDSLLVRFGQDDLVFHVSDNTPAGAHGRARMFTLKVV